MRCSRAPPEFAVLQLSLVYCNMHDTRPEVMRGYWDVTKRNFLHDVQQEVHGDDGLAIWKIWNISDTYKPVQSQTKYDEDAPLTTIIGEKCYCIGIPDKMGRRALNRKHTLAPHRFGLSGDCSSRMDWRWRVDS